MQPWIPSLSTTERRQLPRAIGPSFSFETNVGGLAMEQFVSFRVDETALEMVSWPTVFLVVLCQYLVAKLPEEALPEACESLLELVRFHAPPREVVGSLPPPVSFPATVGEVKERPPVIFDLE